MQKNGLLNQHVNLTNVEIKLLVKYIESFENLVGPINQDLYIKLIKLIGR